jgi:hypothetical protein
MIVELTSGCAFQPYGHKINLKPKGYKNFIKSKLQHKIILCPSENIGENCTRIILIILSIFLDKTTIIEK